MFSAEHKQFESHVCLRVTKYLYNHACVLSEQASPFCFNLIDLLLNTETLIKWLSEYSILDLIQGTVLLDLHVFYTLLS